LVEILFVDENTGYALERMNRGGTILKNKWWSFLDNLTIVIQESMFEVTILASNPKVILVLSVPLLGKLIKSR
jgi:hypothetical protein